MGSSLTPPPDSPGLASAREQGSATGLASSAPGMPSVTAADRPAQDRAGQDGSLVSLRIIEAAIAQFACAGFAGASTREIARASGTAMSSITYHFGGKEGLYLACADHVAEQIGAVHAPLLDQIRAHPPADAESARTALLALLENFARFMLAPQSERFSQFVVREQQRPTEAFERIYARVMAPVLETAVGLLALARPSLDEQARRALVLHCLGMALVLRIARACVARTMEAEDIDPETADMLIASVRRSARTLLMES